MNHKPSVKKPRRPIMDVRVVKRPAKSIRKSTVASPVKAAPAITKKPKLSLIRRLINHPLKSHPFVVPVVTFVALSFVAMAVFVMSNGSTLGASDTKVVNLYVDGKAQVVPTRATTIGELLQRIGIEVQEKDIVEPSVDTEIIESNITVSYFKARTVLIIDGDKQVPVVTAETLPRKAAEAAGVKVYLEDRVEQQGGVIETEDVLRGSLVAETVVINRATPANINLYGSNIPIRTHVKTVGDALKEKNIKTLPDDVITPKLDTPMASNTQIFITRMGKTIDSREEEIAMVTQTSEDPNLPIGRVVVKQQGNPGRKVVTYEVELQNDVEVSRRPIQEIIAVQPVTHVVVKGTKPPTVIVDGDHAALMLQAGIPASQHGAAEYIISRESRWRLDARNSSGCLGLGQACPGSKLINVCPSYANDAICQLQFFNKYAVGRYGSWNGAYQFWLVNHWW